MPSLKIIKSGLMTSIQDMGRKGLAYYAIPRSGVMDIDSAKEALLLLQKPESHPLIECTSIAPHIQFNTATQIVLTGADFDWTIQGKSVRRNTIIDIQAGDTLKGKFAKNALRAYIGINGKLDIPQVYGSYATYTNAKIGGLEGRLLQKGDCIEWETATNIKKIQSTPLPYSTQESIPIRPGPEFSYLINSAKLLLSSTPYKIDAASNRMGMRLLGEKLESSSYQLKYSLPVLPGFIQLPPSGLPIILLQDGQISGGYPRIAYVPETALSRLNQIPLGTEFRFRLLD